MTPHKRTSLLIVNLGHLPRFQETADHSHIAARYPARRVSDAEALFRAQVADRLRSGELSQASTARKTRT